MHRVIIRAWISKNIWNNNLLCLNKLCPTTQSNQKTFFFISGFQKLVSLITVFTIFFYRWIYLTTNAVDCYSYKDLFSVSHLNLVICFVQVGGGYVAEKLSAKHVFGFGALLNIVCTIFTPLAAKASYIVVIALRILMGIGGVSEYQFSDHFRLKEINGNLWVSDLGGICTSFIFLKKIYLGYPRRWPRARAGTRQGSREFPLDGELFSKLTDKK